MSVNSFGRVFRFTTWGESHGPAIGAVVDGCPPGIALTEAEIQPFLDAGIDGFFTDHPDLGVQAVDTWMQGKKEHPGRGVGKTAQRGLKVR